MLYALLANMLNITKIDSLCGCVGNLVLNRWRPRVCATNNKKAIVYLLGNQMALKVGLQKNAQQPKLLLDAPHVSYMWAAANVFLIFDANSLNALQ